LPAMAVDRVIQQISRNWQGHLYHALRRNCCHFARALVGELGVEPLPDWIDRLGRTCEALAAPIDGAVSSGQRAMSTMRAAYQVATMPWQMCCCSKDGSSVLSEVIDLATPRILATPRPLERGGSLVLSENYVITLATPRLLATPRSLTRPASIEWSEDR